MNLKMYNMNCEFTKISTLRDLKNYLISLNDDLLDQEIKSAREEQPYFKVTAVLSLNEDHINPSGECWEPKSDYLPGGQFHDDEIDANAEFVVGKKNEIFFIE